MNKYIYHLGIAVMVGFVVIVVNALALTRIASPSQWLYLVDVAYVAGNSIHAIALSLTKSGLNVDTVTSSKT